jgi:hypothetical protein
MTMTGSKKFNIQVGYLWSVHDFRAYNIFFRMELQWNFDMSTMYEGHILFLSSIGGGRSLTLIVIDVFCPGSPI